MNLVQVCSGSSLPPAVKREASGAAAAPADAELEQVPAEGEELALHLPVAKTGEAGFSSQILNDNDNADGIVLQDPLCYMNIPAYAFVSCAPSAWESQA